MSWARSERGSVVVFVALAMIPILLIAALVIDAGKWFMHNRQLRNRADAAVQAAGVEYARRWPACAGDTLVATEIINAARAYAGGTYNDDITKVDAGDIVVSENPCDPQGPEGRRGLDVDVTERNVSSLSPLFELIGPAVSAPSSIGSGSRVELLQNASDTGFVPLAIEDQRIVKAQARFRSGCGGNFDNPVTLTQVPGTALWRSEFQVTLPNAGSAGFGCPGTDYEPVAVEVRLASRDDVDLNQSCAALIAAPFADCFSDITQFRTYACHDIAEPAICTTDDPGAGTKGPGDPPDVYGVAFSGPSCDPDPYYARLPAASTSCTFAATVYMNWFDRPQGVCEADLVVDGRTYPLAGPCPRPTEHGAWVATGIELRSPGRLEARIDWRWSSREDGGGWNCAPPGPPCRESGSFAIHRTNLADDPVTDTSPSDIVQLVQVTDDPTGATQVHSKHADGTTHLFYLTVGLKSELKPGEFAILRTRFRNDRALSCEPGGQTQSMVAEGCKPAFGPNPLDGGYWWSGTSCPPYGTWFSGPPYANAPWRCLRTEPAPPNASQLADGLSSRIVKPSVPCDPPTGRDGSPDRYLEYYVSKTRPIDPTDPRFVKVYVVPFGGIKGPPDGTVPVLDIAHFYVTDWGAPSGSPDDPCEPDFNSSDDTTIPGRVAGYFVSTVSSNTGPVEPNSPCDPDKLRPCRAVITK